ncbi:MAG: TIGR03364 family FAD-dependent oxidoreductase [Solirubrobacterales bacterium]|nr:TIGR03364 family FAD-dependent oxidoreductase [Solirubrobacterales bacterium]
MRAIEADVCIVGAGIVGLAYAFEARARRLSVAVLERSGEAVGASVRNFGHVIVSAMADGTPLECALAARERWLELGRRAGLEVVEAGTVITARADDELAVMAEIAEDTARGGRLITPREVDRLAPIPTAGLVGGLHARLDLRVDPRRAVAALAALLSRDPGAHVLFNAPVQAVYTGAVESSVGQVRASLVIVCPGPDHDWLEPEITPRRTGMTRCKLQMLRVRAPAGRRYLPALLTALSLPRYPGYSERAGSKQLGDRLAAERPELSEAGVHLIITQLPDGDLLLGDSHQYGDTVSPFGEERLDELVLTEAAGLLGANKLSVRQRWHGVYPSAPGHPFLIARPLPGVAVVEIVSGIGMTTALGLAPATFDALLGSSPAVAVS